MVDVGTGVSVAEGRGVKVFVGGMGVRVYVAVPAIAVASVGVEVFVVRVPVDVASVGAAVLVTVIAGVLVATFGT